MGSTSGIPPDALRQCAVVAIRRQQIERPTTRLVSSAGRKLSVRKRTPQKLLGLPLGDALPPIQIGLFRAVNEIGKA